MPIQWFENLKRFFHMNDNLNLPLSVEKSILILFTKSDHYSIAFWNILEALSGKKLIL